MRAGILVVIGMVGLVGACEERNGTYFVVEGDAITFDQVEFYLGKDHGNETPSTPARPLLAPAANVPAEPQRLTKRRWAPSDVQDIEPTNSYSYYLPADPENQSAHYAMIVASRDGQVVGLGEVEKYNVLGDAAYIYKVPLVPVDQGFERWGTTDNEDPVANTCVRWTRQRPGQDRESTYVVSRESDRDCDGIVEKFDCDDLSYCTSGIACKRRESACVDPVACTIGACVDGVAETNTPKTCGGAARTCLPASFCSPTDACHEDGPADEFLACAIQISLDHAEVSMPVRAPGGSLCGYSYAVTLPADVGCTAPSIVWPPLGRVGSYLIEVMPSTTGGGACTFTWSSTDPLAVPPADTHIVVSVAYDNGIPPLRRASFVVGFQPDTVAPIDCQEMPDVAYPGITLEPSCPSP